MVLAEYVICMSNKLLPQLSGRKGSFTEHALREISDACVDDTTMRGIEATYMKGVYFGKLTVHEL